MKPLKAILNTLKPIQLIFMLYFLGTSTLQAQQFKDYSSEGLVSAKTNPEHALQQLKKSYSIALHKKDTVQIIKNLISLSAAGRATLNYSEAFSHAGEALFVAKEFKNPLLIAKAHEEFGVLHYLFKQDEEAGDHFKAAHAYFSKVKSNEHEAEINLFHSHYNMVLYYQRIKNIQALQTHIEKCLALTKNIPFGNIYALFLNEKKATVLQVEEKKDQALQLLVSSSKALENLQQKGQLNAKMASFLTILYCRIANSYVLEQQLSTAKTYYEKSLEIPDATGENTFYRAFVYLRYAELLFQLKDFENAYTHLAKSKAINDTYLNPRNEDTQGFLTIKNRYSDQLRKKNELLYAQNLELQKQTQALFRFRIFFFVTVLLSIIIALMVRSKIRSLKHQKKEELNQEQIESKNKELTANMLQLIEKEEIINTLREHLETTPTDTATKKILNQIEKNSVTLWDSFNNRFMALNENFYERLQEKAPDLSSADLKICALIKLNFSGKEMAHLLGISLGSVHVARHRLRKKMDLERDINLTNFINSI
ncbi:hypothetical protein SLW70_15675 [Flavobacterium sp. NG2]|uniref:helix-turn-helix transcriptional regulator n=1 Tax=Flavobacterium sp. NG2 TaxID=3097547 RepID=UPI002A839EB1|nr:hypothetical protein [Flavobacterium sp. NG2]WPR71353.1 hypothetical protein SLW70_15675 [Flavobacterium sp. NG2]